MSAEFRVQGLDVSRIAESYGTPLFVYDGRSLAERITAVREALPDRLEIFYSLKANPNVSICALLAARGARAEVSSLTELRTAQRAGVAAEDIIFLGPGKSSAELEACLDDGVFAIVCESFGELEDLDALAAARDVQAPVALRVNPSFAVKGSGLTMGGKPRQFGIDEEQLLADPGLTGRFRHLRLMGVHAYMGTRFLGSDAVVQNTERILDLADRISSALGFELELVDVGGGIGVAYFDGEQDFDLAAFASRANPVLEDFAHRHPGARLAMELGRYLTGEAGVYVTRVRYVKTSLGQRFAVADGGTNHHMAAVGIGSFVKRNFPVRVLNRMDETASQTWNITGPLCTPSDTVAKNAPLPPLQPGDLVGVLRSGAYGPSASPVQFLGHGHPAEVLVLDGRAHLVRQADEPEDLLRQQRLVEHDAASPEAVR